MDNKQEGRKEKGGESPPGTYPRHTGIRTAKEGVVVLGKTFVREKKVDCGDIGKLI